MFEFEIHTFFYLLNFGAVILSLSAVYFTFLISSPLLLIIPQNKLTQVADLRERVNTKEADNQREIKRREKTQKELQDARTKLDDKVKREEDMLVELLNSKTAVTDLERQLVDAKSVMEKHLREFEALQARAQRVSTGEKEFGLCLFYFISTKENS